jgi:hypothetical protein
MISEHISASHTMRSTLLRADFQASVCTREFSKPAQRPCFSAWHARSYLAMSFAMHA